MGVAPVSFITGLSMCIVMQHAAYSVTDLAFRLHNDKFVH